MAPAFVSRRRKRFKDGAKILDRIVVAADHHAVALFQSPHPARSTHIDKLEALGGNFGVAAHGVLVIRVTAVDQNVAGALSVGMKAVQYTGAEALQRELVGLGVMSQGVI